MWIWLRDLIESVQILVILVCWHKNSTSGDSRVRSRVLVSAYAHALLFTSKYSFATPGQVAYLELKPLQTATGAASRDRWNEFEWGGLP